MFFEKIAQKILFLMDPEKAHHLAIKGLRSGLLPIKKEAHDPRLRTRLCGIDFSNPLGMAAGFDKNAQVPDSLFNLGFGFVEVGTVTPLPQSGNPKPRLFRLEDDCAVINRLGFNNAGHVFAESSLKLQKPSRSPDQILGVNIGANSNSSDRISDYVLGVKRFAPLADYITINISSPNTKGLRNLQTGDLLIELLERVIDARNALNSDIPLFLKIAPDFSIAELETLASQIKKYNIQGTIVSNTTLQHPPLKTPRSSAYSGGLSGKPLFMRSTAVLAHMRNLLGSSHVLIGVGGVDSAETALEKIRAGGDLVQLYTALIYEGLSLPHTILNGLSKILDTRKCDSISTLRDENLSFWLRQKI